MELIWASLLDIYTGAWLQIDFVIFIVVCVPCSALHQAFETVRFQVTRFTPCSQPSQNDDKFTGAAFKAPSGAFVISAFP